jgi:hypothetical protein
VLYHWNWGAPFLEQGARFVAPIRVAVPRDARAQEGLEHFDVYEGPQPGFAEQAYFFELHASASDGRTLALLRNRAGDKGIVLRFAKVQLPAFTLWKNSGGLNEGFVTGLEPGTGYPNARPFEKTQKRIPTLPVGGRYVADTVLEVHHTRDAVAEIEAEIAALQAQGPREVLPEPALPYAPSS